MRLCYIFLLFLLCTLYVQGQGNTDQTHFCGTLSPQEQKLEDLYQNQQKSKEKFSAKGGLKQSGKILYVPFKFKGEDDPSITNMEAVKAFYLENSYGIYTLSWDITPVIELPFTRQEDIDSSSIYWVNTLKEEWEKLGYDRSQYDFLVQRAHYGSPFMTGAAGVAGGTTIKVSTASVGVLAHEIGHTLYYASGYKNHVLHHANLWIANNNQTIGPGVSQEYGNKFALMGGSALRDFGLPRKLNMQWIKQDEYSHVADNGTYRIYHHDKGSKQTGRKYGIKVGKKAHPTPQPGNLYYFIEYNSKVSGTHDGVIILTENQTEHTNLFDMHPGTNTTTGKNEGWRDAPLAVGETFRDSAAGITIKTMASGGSGNNAWMDVQITFDDPSSTDHLTDINFITPTDGQTFDASTDIPVEISASDPDGPIIKVYLSGTSFFPLTDTSAPYNFTINQPAGTYVLRTWAETANGRSNDKRITIHIVDPGNTTLTADAGIDKTLNCTTTQVTLGGANTTDDATYTWATSNGNIVSGGAAKNATVDKTGTYTLTVSKSGSTTVTDDVVVTQDTTPPTANAGADKTINSGESTQLTATGGGTYAWSPTSGLSNANIANPMASPTTTMTYTVTVMGSNGCTATDQVTVNISGTVDSCTTPPIANAGEDVTIEQGNSTQLTAIGGSTYSWSPTEGLSDATISNPEANPTVTTTYTVTVTDSKGCTAIDEVIITVVDKPEIEDGVLGIALSIYPNPVVEMATIAYSSSSEITGVSLFDLLGRGVRVISDELLPSGEHELSLKTDGLTPGIYMLKISVRHGALSKKIVVTR